jgi:hypothetical protein
VLELLVVNVECRSVILHEDAGGQPLGQGSRRPRVAIVLLAVVGMGFAVLKAHDVVRAPGLEGSLVSGGDGVVRGRDHPGQVTDLASLIAKAAEWAYLCQGNSWTDDSLIPGLA